MDARVHVWCLLRLADLRAFVRSVVALAVTLWTHRRWLVAAACAFVVIPAYADPPTVTVSAVGGYDVVMPANVHIVRTGYRGFQFYSSEATCRLQAIYVGSLYDDSTVHSIHTPVQGSWFSDGLPMNAALTRVSPAATLFRGCGGGTGNASTDGIITSSSIRLRVFPHLDGVWRFLPQTLPEDADFEPRNFWNASGLIPSVPVTYTNVDGTHYWTLGGVTFSGSQLPGSDAADLMMMFQRVRIPADGRTIHFEFYIDSRFVPVGGSNQFIVGGGVPVEVMRFELVDGLPWESTALEVDLSTIEALLGNLRTYFVTENFDEIPNYLPEPGTKVDEAFAFAADNAGSARGWIENFTDRIAGNPEPPARNFTIDWQYLALVSSNDMNNDGRIQADLSPRVSVGSEPPSLVSNVIGPWWWYTALHFAAQVLAVVAVLLTMARDVIRTWESVA